ncbi:hypothetical protein [Plebeiibacterium sediminum]|uniref:Uncharacterized protein n=1 Tax=Plebeiibacterium sediminum TaxID=2992112 RepID=A0AAE3M890_9BACT|nr:hypothetical protein [Plebeiobacterium sediminum]MCW3788903.1 hypothetical protein [Plebeiobacterium sediminum]
MAKKVNQHTSLETLLKNSNVFGEKDVISRRKESKISENLKNNKDNKSSPKIKGTYYFEPEIIFDAKCIAYYYRTSIGKILNKALKLYINNAEDLDKARDAYSKKE